MAIKIVAVPRDGGESQVFSIEDNQVWSAYTNEDGTMTIDVSWNYELTGDCRTVRVMRGDWMSIFSVEPTPQPSREWLEAEKKRARGFE